MTTARKAPAKKAAPRKLAAVTEDARFDLASIFDTDHLDPVPIKLLGIRGVVRRDYTGEEVIKFSSLVGNSQFDVEAILGLITDVGDELWAKISVMDPARAAQLLNKIVEMSGLHEGKLFAPLNAS